MQVLRYDDAAKRANLTRRSLERLIVRGEGPAIIHISERRRGILESDLEKWLLSRRHPAPAEAVNAPRKRGRPRKTPPVGQTTAVA